MKLIYDIEPVEQARPRITTRPFPRLYDPDKVRTYKDELRRLSEAYMSDLSIEPLSGQLEVRVIFYRRIQKSISKKERTRRLHGLSLRQAFVYDRAGVQHLRR